MRALLLVLCVSFFALASCAAPADWCDITFVFCPYPFSRAERVAQGHMMYSDTIPSDVSHMPFVGNGFVATTLTSDTM